MDISRLWTISETLNNNFFIIDWLINVKRGSLNGDIITIYGSKTITKTNCMRVR